MKKLMMSAAAVIAMLTVASHAQADVLYFDDFDAADGAYSASTSFVSPSGSVPALTSYGSSIDAQYAGGALSLNDGGDGNTPVHEGLSFGGTTTPFNWATSSASADILNEGLQIKFDALLNSDSSYISIGFGSFDGVPDGTAGFGAIYDSSDMDWGIRWERDRMISFLANGTTTPSYRTDQDPGAYSFGSSDWFEVLLELDFDGSFDAGTTVTASTTITNLSTGTVVSLTDFDSFTLGATDDFRFDFSSNLASGSNLVDNLLIAVPEPSSASLLVLATIGLLGRRRKS